jgi:hypothetical protein
MVEICPRRLCWSSFSRAMVKVYSADPDKKVASDPNGQRSSEIALENKAGERTLFRPPQHLSGASSVRKDFVANAQQ